MLLLLLLLGVLSVYAYFLNKRIVTPHPAAYAYSVKPISDDELATLTYPTSEDMAKAAGAPTGNAYIIIGGSGYAGGYIVRTLLGRGETLVRIVDIVPPNVSGDSNAKDHLSHAEFVKADVTDYESVKHAISLPFGTGTTAHVIIHTAAAVRASERLPYVKHLSYKVNVNGIQNVLKVSQELGTVRAFVFTSSAAVFLPPAMYLRLTRKYGPVFTGDTIPTETPLLHSHYSSSKREADTLVRAADNIKGIRTGVLRPGMAIAGAGEPWATLHLSNPAPNIVWGGGYFQNTINAWDLARAHILFADALETRPDEVGGLGFAITGQPTPCSTEDMRRAMQVCCHHNLRFQSAPALPLYILSHFMEVYFMARFYALDALSKFTGTKATYAPQWAIDSFMDRLQPAMWDFICADFIIDDSQVRKILGYRNLWSNEQTVKWTVDSFEGRAK